MISINGFCHYQTYLEISISSATNNIQNEIKLSVGKFTILLYIFWANINKLPFDNQFNYITWVSCQNILSNNNEIKN